MNRSPNFIVSSPSKLKRSKKLDLASQNEQSSSLSPCVNRGLPHKALPQLFSRGSKKSVIIQVLSCLITFILKQNLSNQINCTNLEEFKNQMDEIKQKSISQDGMFLMPMLIGDNYHYLIHLFLPTSSTWMLHDIAKEVLSCPTPSLANMLGYFLSPQL